MPIRLTDDERLSRIMVTDDCWLWMGASASGYGTAGAGVLAHRWAYAYWNGPIPDGSYVCHRCDVPLCVNPDHLWLGDAKSNMLDRSMKGRTGRAKVTPEMVRGIREKRAAGRSQQSIADEYGLSQSNVSSILRRTTHHHVT
jgi:hypothetical protein